MNKSYMNVEIQHIYNRKAALFELLIIPPWRNPFPIKAPLNTIEIAIIAPIKLMLFKINRICSLRTIHL